MAIRRNGYQTESPVGNCVKGNEMFDTEFLDLPKKYFR